MDFRTTNRLKPSFRWNKYINKIINFYLFLKTVPHEETGRFLGRWVFLLIAGGSSDFLQKISLS